MRKAPERVSLSTVAARAGVSVSTVSRIANGQIDRANAETVRRVRALLDDLGYRPDGIGRALRRGASRIVAMLAPNLDNPAMGAIATATEAALREAGYVMILCDTHDEPALQDEYLEAMRAQAVEGYVLVSCVASSGLASFLARGEPMVLVGRRPPADAPPAPFVGIDNRAAGAEAAAFFLASGLDRPAVLHTALAQSSAIADRVAGFIQRLEDNGVPSGDIRLAGSSKLQHLFAGHEAAAQLVADGGWPNGLFCVSDLMAYGAYRLACEHGVIVPRQCLIVGVDDNRFNDWIAPWLTSVRIPYEDYGGAVVDQLKALWSGAPSQDRLLPHRLVVRTGAPT